jgi:cyclic pyranopterin monophosphate synthase
LDFSHLDSNGNVNMVDVSDKDITKRSATVSGKIILEKKTIELINNDKIKKGNVITTAKIAGIMAAKKTYDLIPLAHNIQLTSIDIDFMTGEDYIEAVSTVISIGKTGAEMEALQSVSSALLTIYDMCKAVDKNMIISDIKLCRKSKTSV